MRPERIVLIMLVFSVLLKFLWPVLGWGGEDYILYPIFISLLALVIIYFGMASDGFYRLIFVYFFTYVIAIILNILEWKGKGITLFIGHLGFLLFAIFFPLKKDVSLDNRIFLWSVFLGLVIIAQCFLYLFINTALMIMIGHILSYAQVLIVAAILHSKSMEGKITQDEKNILRFLIIVNILSLLGITFNENFYSTLWI